MNLDKNGLPVQANGDANDQLQRCGMISIAGVLGGDFHQINAEIVWNCLCAVDDQTLQPRRGLFRRHPEASTNNCSADQIIAALADGVAYGVAPSLMWAMARCLARLGFAQNYRDGLGSNRLQVPDFMLLRAAPLFARASKLLYPLACIADLYLLVLVLGDFVYSKVGKDPVDVNNTLLTLVVCRERMVTPLSWLACKLWPRLRPDIYGALARYHRAEAGGNPEIAEFYKPIIKRIFG